MKWQLDFSIPPSNVPIQYTDKLIFIGSCFSEHTAQKMKSLGFDLVSNPSGIHYNPLAIAKTLLAVRANEKMIVDQLFESNSIWSSFDFHSSFSAATAPEALQKMNDSLALAAEQLKKASFLFVSFGSAHAYRLKETRQPVGNCHKLPAKLFDKVLLTSAEMEEEWEQLIQNLKAYNPALQIVFTVSPVRYAKDGLVENNRSKANLIGLVHSLTEHFDYCHYFPAYELVIDVLRDHRFYKEDMVHPSPQAIDYIFEQFTSAWIAPAAKELMNRVVKLTQERAHRPLFGDSPEFEQFQLRHNEKFRQLLTEFPFLKLQLD